MFTNNRLLYFSLVMFIVSLTLILLIQLNHIMLTKIKVQDKELEHLKLIKKLGESNFAA